VTIDERRQVANKVEDAIHAFAQANELPIDQLAINPDRNNSSELNMRLRTILPEPYNWEIDKIARQALSRVDKSLHLNCG